MHLLKITQRKLQAFLKYQKKNGTNWLDEPLEYLFKYHRWEMPDQMSWGKWSDVIVRQLVKVFMRRTLQDGSASTCSLNKKDVLVTKNNDGYTKNVFMITYITRFWMRKYDQKLEPAVKYFAIYQSKMKYVERNSKIESNLFSYQTQYSQHSSLCKFSNLENLKGRISQR